MITLKDTERLVFAGNVALRAPDGTILPSVPQYMIVPTNEADPALITEIQENERLVYGGRIFNDKKTAEERFAALKAGRNPPPREAGTPLYFKEDAANINPETERTHEGDKIIATLAKEFAGIFALHMRKKKALAKQGKS